MMHRLHRTYRSIEHVYPTIMQKVNHVLILYEKITFHMYDKIYKLRTNIHYSCSNKYPVVLLLVTIFLYSSGFYFLKSE